MFFKVLFKHGEQRFSSTPVDSSSPAGKVTAGVLGMHLIMGHNSQSPQGKARTQGGDSDSHRAVALAKGTGWPSLAGFSKFPREAEYLRPSV